MAARIEEREIVDQDGNDATNVVIVAQPSGRYGFGTLGGANPQRTLTEAWRMVQRAGLTGRAIRGSGRLLTEQGGVCWVEYEVRPLTAEQIAR